MSLISLSGTSANKLKNLLRGTPSSSEQYQRNYARNFGHRAVWVRVAGGTAGSATTTCTLTYNIYQPGTGELLASALTPIRPRYPNIEYNSPANDTYGTAFKDGTGWRLVEALLEYPKTETCE